MCETSFCRMVPELWCMRFNHNHRLVLSMRVALGRRAHTVKTQAHEKKYPCDLRSSVVTSSGVGNFKPQMSPRLGFSISTAHTGGVHQHELGWTLRGRGCLNRVQIMQLTHWSSPQGIELNTAMHFLACPWPDHHKRGESG